MFSWWSSYPHIARLERCRVAAAATLGTGMSGNVCVVAERCHVQCLRDADSIANTSATSVQCGRSENGTVTYIIKPPVLDVEILGGVQELVRAYAAHALRRIGWSSRLLQIYNYILYLCVGSRMKQDILVSTC